ERKFAKADEWRKWVGSDVESLREASTTAVTTYPQGMSHTGVWDGSGNVWEWTSHPSAPGSATMALRGGAWLSDARSARVSYRGGTLPVHFAGDVGVRVVVAPVL